MICVYVNCLKLRPLGAERILLPALSALFDLLYEGNIWFLSCKLKPLESGLGRYHVLLVIIDLVLNIKDKLFHLLTFLEPFLQNLILLLHACLILLITIHQIRIYTDKHIHRLLLLNHINHLNNLHQHHLPQLLYRPNFRKLILQLYLIQ